MRHFWVGFDPWSPSGDQYLVSKGTWVSVEEFDADVIERTARMRLEAPEGVQMTTMVEFSEGDYAREKRREWECMLRRDPLLALSN